MYGGAPPAGRRSKSLQNNHNLYFRLRALVISRCTFLLCEMKLILQIRQGSNYLQAVHLRSLCYNISVLSHAIRWTGSLMKRSCSVDTTRYCRWVAVRTSFLQPLGMIPGGVFILKLLLYVLTIGENMLLYSC